MRTDITDSHNCCDRGQRPDDLGATAAEYAFLAALIAMAIFVTVGLLGVSVSDVFETPLLMDAVTQ